MLNLLVQLSSEPDVSIVHLPNRLNIILLVWEWGVWDEGLTWASFLAAVSALC